MNVRSRGSEASLAGGAAWSEHFPCFAERLDQRTRFVPKGQDRRPSAPLFRQVAVICRLHDQQLHIDPSEAKTKRVFRGGFHVRGSGAFGDSLKSSRVGTCHVTKGREVAIFPPLSISPPLPKHADLCKSPPTRRSVDAPRSGSVQTGSG